MTRIVELPPDALVRLGEVDRSEHITRQYVLRDGVLRERAVDIRAAPWDRRGDGPHSVSARVAAWGPVLARGGVLLGALEEPSGCLAGFALLLPILDPEHDPRLAELVALYVDAGARGRGVGAALMQAAVARARASGAERLYVSATPSAPTVDFYRAAGCVLADPPHPGRLAAEPDDIHMVLHLMLPHGVLPGDVLPPDGIVLRVEQGDITRFAVDGLVNAANETLLGGGGVDGAIHRAAGPALLEACRALPQVRPGVRCPTGEARLTPGFGLAARHVIHTVGPVWRGGAAGEDELLARCYRACLHLADAHGLATLAFPAISCGVYGFPVERAADIAVGCIRAHAAGRGAEAGRSPRRAGGVTEVVLVGFDADMQRVLIAAVERPERAPGA